MRDDYYLNKSPLHILTTILYEVKMWYLFSRRYEHIPGVPLSSTQEERLKELKSREYNLNGKDKKELLGLRAIKYGVILEMLETSSRRSLPEWKRKELDRVNNAADNATIYIPSRARSGWKCW